MEKFVPHCKLTVIKSLVKAGQIRATVSSFEGARALGIHTLENMSAVVLDLRTKDFHKSMTTHADHRIWQDVYHARTESGDAVYLKLIVVNDVLIVSFKEL